MSTSSSVSCWIRSLSSWSEREPRSGKVSIGRAYQRIGDTQAEVEGGCGIAAREAAPGGLPGVIGELAPGAARVLLGGDERHGEADVDEDRARRLPPHEPREQRRHDRRDRQAAPPVDLQLDAAA